MYYLLVNSLVELVPQHKIAHLPSHITLVDWFATDSSVGELTNALNKISVKCINLTKR